MPADNTTVSFQRILRRALALCGVSFAARSTADVLAIASGASLFVGDVWGRHYWPAALAGVDRQVTDGILHTADVPEFTEVLRVFTKDPFLYDDAIRLRFTQIGSRVSIQPRDLLNEDGDVWVLGRLPAPEWEGDDWDAGQAYTEGDRVFHLNEFYTALQTASGQEPPDVDFWEPVQAPPRWVNLLATAAWANWLAGEGQLEKAAAAWSQAEEMVITELDILERQQGQTGWSRILTMQPPRQY